MERKQENQDQNIIAVCKSEAEN